MRHRPLLLASLLTSSLGGIAGCSDEAPQPPPPVSLVAPTPLEPPAGTADATSSGVRSVTHPASARLDNTQAVSEKGKPGEPSSIDRLRERAKTDPEARCDLAMRHLVGSGVEKSREAAMLLLREAAEQGSARAANNLATLLVAEQREESLALYERASSMGDVDAKRHAAFILAYQEDGVTLSTDPARIEKAKIYLRDAASSGDLFADAALGALLADEGDIKRAAPLLAKAAMGGVSSAMDRLIFLSESQPGLVDSGVLAKVKTMKKEIEG